MKYIISIIAFILILGIWFPVIPFPVKRGYHGPNGEFCGIIYDPKCDTNKIGLFTYAEIQKIIQNHAY
jgi:hypothetical protein